MGVPSNKDYLACVMGDPRFAAGETTTSFLQDMHFSPHGIEVIDAGMNTTVQVSSSLILISPPSSMPIPIPAPVSVPVPITVSNPIPVPVPKAHVAHVSSLR